MSESVLTINQKDLDRMLKKLGVIQRSLVDDKGPTLKYFFKLTDAYCATIASGMGTVDPGKSDEGGRYITENLPTPFLGDQVTVKWKELAARTVRDKEAYQYEVTTAIWMASGLTRNTVKPWVNVFKHSVTVGGGIRSKDDAEAYRRALAVETGAAGAWEERALFAKVNEIFLQHHDEIVTNVQAAVRETILQARWGF